MIRITIDGPSGAGKSTVAKAVAKKLDIIYLDTGAIYRAFAYAATKNGIDVDDCGAVEKFLENADIEVKYSGEKENKKAENSREKKNEKIECSNREKDAKADVYSNEKENEKAENSSEKKNENGAENGGIDPRNFGEKNDIKKSECLDEKENEKIGYSNEKENVKIECSDGKGNAKIGYSDGKSGRAQRVFCNKIDVTDFIREHNISKAASDISRHIPVRIRLSEIQREIARKNDVVLDGRDAGTFVLPDANFKFFLTADLVERAERRYAELKEKGGKLTLEKVLEDIKLRDFNDSNRSFAPLKQASDAILIDSTHMTADEVAELIIKRVRGEN
jgi:cytidylate kinase